MSTPEERANRAAYMREWSARNRQKIRDQKTAARAANPELDRTRRAVRRQANPESVARDRARTAKWVADNPDKKAASDASWVAANPERDKRNRQASKALRRGRLAGVRVERVHRDVVWKRDMGICHICQMAADPLDWHLEHVIPIARGGSHTYENVAVSHPLCNRRKGAKINGG